MEINNISPSSVSAKVWSQTTRKVTSLFPPMTVGSTIQGVIAATTTVTFTPTASTLQFISAGVITNAAAASATTINYYDGTTKFLLVTIAANSVGALPIAMIGGSLLLTIVNGDATHSAIYSSCSGVFA